MMMILLDILATAEAFAHAAGLGRIFDTDEHYYLKCAIIHLIVALIIALTVTLLVALLAR